MSPRQRRVLSYYDNISPTASTNINNANNSIVSNESIKRRNQKLGIESMSNLPVTTTGATKNLASSNTTKALNVLRTTNNVTYVAVGGDDIVNNMGNRIPFLQQQQPYLPPPDYNSDDGVDEEQKLPISIGKMQQQSHKQGHFYQQMIHEDGKWQKPNPHLNHTGSIKLKSLQQQQGGNNSQFYYETAGNYPSSSETTIRRF